MPSWPVVEASRSEGGGRKGRLRRKIVLRLVSLAVTAVALYLFMPALTEVFAESGRLRDIKFRWFAVVFAFETCSFVCLWWMTRIALPAASWFGISTSQLSSNAFSRVVPGGAAAGAALQYRMLTVGGLTPAAVGAGLTTVSLLLTATIFILPLFTLPAIIGGTPVPTSLAAAAWLGAVAALLMIALGAVLLFTDGLLKWLAKAIGWIIGKVRRSEPAPAGTEKRLLRERDNMKTSLGDSWFRAGLATVGKWGFDYLALLGALAAVGAEAPASVLLLAYVSAAFLAMIPITPGGLGFVEAGLTGALVLAGVNAGDAALAVLLYRLFNYWLPIPAGGIAYLLHRRRFHARRLIDVATEVVPAN
jgi:uncharacterized protein (TIRG00374 family)